MPYNFIDPLSDTKSFIKIYPQGLLDFAVTKKVSPKKKYLMWKLCSILSLVIKLWDMFETAS